MSRLSQTPIGLNWLQPPQGEDCTTTEAYLHGVIWRAGSLMLDQLGAEISEVAQKIPDLSDANPQLREKAGILRARTRETRPIYVGTVTTSGDVEGEEASVHYQLVHNMGAGYYQERRLRGPKFVGKSSSIRHIREMTVRCIVDIDDEFGADLQIPAGQALTESTGRIPERLTIQQQLRPWQMLHQLQFATALNAMAEAQGIAIADLLNAGTAQ